MSGWLTRWVDGSLGSRKMDQDLGAVELVRMDVWTEALHMWLGSG